MTSFSVHNMAVAAAAVLWGSIAVCATSLWVHSRGWRAGRAAPVDWLRAAVVLPRRYLVDVHAVAARHRLASWMHAMLAGGFLLSIAGWTLFPWTASIYWTAVQAIALASSGGGLLLLAARRQPGRVPSTRPQRLSGGRFVWLAAVFLVYWLASLGLLISLITGRGDTAGFAAMASTVALVAATVYLVAFAMRHPLRHALLGALYIATHPKAARFAQQGSPAASGGGAALREGVAKAGDFDWKQLLSFDACVECGRCQAVCPAHATGHPLNPKALIQDLVRSTGLRGEPYRGDGHTTFAPSGGDATRASVMGIAAETLWSCTTCAACVDACPMFIEHVDAVTDLRRHMTQSLGAVPGKLPVLMRELRESGNSFGLPASHRWSWASDLKPRLFSDVQAAEVLVWAGDAGFELHGQQSLHALLQMLEMAEVDYAVLGDEEQDCGHLSRRCGDESAFAELRAANLATFERYSFDTLITADPHAFHTLSVEYPRAGWEVVHHTEYLARLLDSGRLHPVASANRKVVYHDACYLGRHGQVYDAPRSVLDKAGCMNIEAPRSRSNSFCCGAGGGQAWAGQPSLKSIPLVRYDELAATGAAEIAVACPNCKNMLQSAAGGAIPVRDIAEILRAAL